MPDQYKAKKWDVVIVGTGMGGATLGYALARAGKRVLFCERGRSHLTDSQALRGNFGEMFFDRHEAPAEKHAAVLARAGRFTEPVEDRSGPRPRRYIPFIGCGTGGSSALYGMVLERFYPEDFSPGRQQTHPIDANLPDRWPVSYREFSPYYQAAETLFHVRGTLDPLRTSELDPLPAPPAMTGASAELYRFLTNKGLHPYQLPTACRRLPGCLGCQSFLCPKACKQDAASVCLAPAIEKHGAALLDRCQVIRLEAAKEKITGVTCRRDGDTFTLRGDLIVLAAGALQTPCILLRSRSTDWPTGLANRSGLVGRNLMRHFIDLYAVFLKTSDGLGSPFKEIAFNDFYCKQPETETPHALGTVQSFGALPPAPVLVASMEEEIRAGRLSWLIPGYKLAKPLLRRFLASRLSRSLILASIVEDLPYHDNRVRPSSNCQGTVLEYRLKPHDKSRIRLMRQKVSSALTPYRFMMLKQAENNERIAHACGTCRFGNDPKTSVLNANNQAHDLANLYIVDGSFFPSSAGTNPALTIAANALRVADCIVDGNHKPTPASPGSA